MKKLIILVILLILGITQISAQNPWCLWDDKHEVGKVIYFSVNVISNEEGCPFRFVLKDPDGIGWYPGDGITITIDDIDYDFVTLPMGTPYADEIKFLPSGEVQFYWSGAFSPGINCFKIYNSLDSLIYESPFIGFPDRLFLIYQNECPECIPLTNFEGEYIQEAKQVNLSWTAPESTDVTGFDIFRNDELIDHVAPTVNSYSSLTDSLKDGDYRYCVFPVYPYLCTFEEACFATYISNVGINTYSAAIHIYPNPANNVINISGDLVSEVRIYNSIGQLLLIQSKTNTIDVSGLTNGIYTFTVETSTGSIIHKKIIINH